MHQQKTPRHTAHHYCALCSQLLSLPLDRLNGIQQQTASHGDACPSLESLHECLHARFSNGSQLIYEVSPAHGNDSVHQSACAPDLITNLVQGIRSIRDQLLKGKLVLIESIDDEGHEGRDFCLKGKGLYRSLSMLYFFKHLDRKTI